LDNQSETGILMAIISQNPVKHSLLDHRRVITAKWALNLNTVLKKQSQFSECRMDVSICHTKCYVNSGDWARGENKPKQSQSLSFGTKYEALHSDSEGRDPKIGNGRTCWSAIMQNKANFQDSHMNVTSCRVMNYHALVPPRPRRNKARQTQFQSRKEGLAGADHARLTVRQFSAILAANEMYLEEWARS
jgi:hypothetical protein